MNELIPITIQDVAKRANVAISTVSRVLNARGGSIPISEDTCKRVRAIATELNYVPNMLANQLRNGRTNLLSLILPWNVPEIMDMAEMTAKKLGYRLMVQFTPSPDKNAEKQSLMTALECRADGVVWMPTPQADRCQEVLRKFRARNTPIIVLEGERDIFSDNIILDFDYEQGYRQAVEHLVSNGYRRLFYFSHFPDVRIPFFTQACRQMGVEGRVFDTNSSQDILSIFQEMDEPVGVISGGDWTGLTVLRAVQELNKRIPQEVGILIIGDLLIGSKFHVGELTTPRMSSLIRPFGEMARQAIEVLDQVKTSPSTAVSHYKSLPMSLCIRESTVR